MSYPGAVVQGKKSGREDEWQWTAFWFVPVPSEICGWLGSAPAFRDGVRGYNRCQCFCASREWMEQTCPGGVFCETEAEAEALVWGVHEDPAPQPSLFGGG